MECLNKIELKGFVGNITHNNGTSRFSLCVEEVFKAKDEVPLIQNTWFNCTAFEGNEIKDLQKIKRGTKVHVIGRVRMQRLLSSSENERFIWEVICTSIEIIED